MKALEINTDYGFTQPATKKALGISASALTESSAEMTNVEAEGVLVALESRAEAISDSHPENVASTLLQKLGFASVPENMELLRILVQNGFPVTKENMTMLNRSQKLTGLPAEKAIFLMLNEIKPTTETAEQLKGYINREIRLLEQLTRLAEQIDVITDKELRDTLVKLFTAEPELVNSDVPQQFSAAQRFESLPAIVLPESTVQPQSAAESLSDVGELNVKTPVTSALHEIAEVILPENTENIFRFAEEVAKNPGKVFIALEKQAEELSQKFSLKTNLREISETKKLIFELVAARLREGARPEAAKIIAEYPIKHESEQTKNLLPAKYIINAAKSTPKDIDKMLSGARQAVEKIKQELQKSGLQDGLAYKAANDIAKNIDFTNELKSAVYVQLPMVVNETRTDCELFVFRDKRKKGGCASSALISLDLASLGHLECYLTKNQNSVNCQFRLDNEDAGKLIKTEIGRLISIFGEKNLHLETVSYKMLEEPFVLTDSEPDSRTPGHDRVLNGVDIRA